DYAGGGEVSFAFDAARSPQTFEIIVRDRGQGLRDLDAVLDGTWRSPTGMGLGITGSQRLMDRFEIESTPRGTTVSMARHLPHERAALRGEELERIVNGAATLALQADSLEEVQQQNRELVATLDELREPQEELARLTQELE